MAFINLYLGVYITYTYLQHCLTLYNLYIKHLALSSVFIKFHRALVERFKYIPLQKQLHATITVLYLYAHS